MSVATASADYAEAQVGDGEAGPEQALRGVVAAQIPRGVDATVAKALPGDFSNRQQDYKDFRLKLMMYEKLCARRGQDCLAEGVLLLFSSLTGISFKAVKTLNPDDLDTAFGQRLIRETFDAFFQYDDTVEAPQRCEEYF